MNFRVTLVLLFCTLGTFAQKTFTTTGDWSEPSNWSPIGAPEAGDVVLVNPGVTLTIDEDAVCDSLFFIAGTTSSNVVIENGISLTVTNNVRFSDPTANSINQIINVGEGFFECNNITFINTSANSRTNQLLVSTGIITINGNIVMEGNNAAKNRIVFSGTGLLDITGSWIITTGTFTPSTGSVQYSNVSAQNVRGTTYNKLILSGGTKTLSGTTVINDTLMIEPVCTLDNSTNISLTTNGVLFIEGTYIESNTLGNVTLVGLVHIASGGTFQSSVNESFTIRNGIRNDGTFISGAGTYTFNTNSQSITGSNAITFSGPVAITGITVTNNNTTTIGGNLTGTGELINSAGLNLTLNGATNSITTLTATSADNTVIFGRSGNQTVPGTTYQNISFGGSSTKTVLGNIIINDELAIASNVTFALSTFTLAAGGGFSNSGLGNLSTANTGATPIPSGLSFAGTVLYSSASAQTVIDGNYTNLNLSGGNRTLTSSGTIFISGIYTPGAGTFTVGTSTINFNGSGAQTIPAASYFNLTSSSTGARTLAATGNILIAGTFTPGTNSYTITGSTINFNNGADLTIPNFTYNSLAVTDGFTKTIPGSLTLNGNLILTSGRLAIGNNTLTINGTVTSTATNSIVSSGSSNLTFGGSGAATTFHLDQTVDGTTNSINTFTINRSTTLVTMGNNMHVSNALNLTSGRLSPGANTLTIAGTFSGTNTNAISGNGSTSTVIFNGSGNVNLFLDQTTSGTTNRLGTLTFNRTGNILTLNNATQTAVALNVLAGKLAINKQLLTINGTVTSDATNNITAGPGCNVTFGGSGDATFFLDQTTPATTNRISTLTINRSGNTINMGNNVNLGRLTLSAGAIAIASNTLTVDSTAAIIFGAAMSATAHITCNGSSNLVINTSNDANLTNGTIFFNQSVTGTTNRLANFTINLGGSSRALTIGTNLQVQNNCTVTQGRLGIAAVTLTINSTLATNTNGTISANGTSSVLEFGGTGNVSLFMSQATNGTTNRLGTLTFNRAGNVLTMSNALQTANALNLTNGQLAIGTNTLTINGSISSTATNNFISNASSNITFGGSGDATFFMDQTASGTTNRLAVLTVNRTGNTITMGNDLQLARLIITTGALAIGSNTLTMSNTSANLFGAAMSTSAFISCNGSSNFSVTATDNNAVTNSTLFFDQTTNGVTNRLGTFTLNLGSNARTLTMGSNLQVNTSLVLTRGDLVIGSNTLTLNGTLINDASNNIASNGLSNLTIAGSGALGSNLFLSQTTPATTNRFGNFTYNRSSQTITLGNTMEITESVNPTAGTLASAGFLTLISNATTTACLTIGSGSYITGNVTMQRFVPAVARRFRFMSSPAISRTLADWQGEFFITGTGGAINGFDATPSNGSTVFSYNEATSGTNDLGWTAATNITNTLTTGRGYRVFVRGDRSNPGRLNDTEPSQNEVTVNTIGAPNIGSIVMPVTFTNTGAGADDGWNLLGNPYPCHYNWNTFFDDGTNLTNIDPTIFIFDPNSNSYKSFNANSNLGDITSGIIPSGSAFFVRANAASPAITFTESFKVTTAPTALFKTNNLLAGLRIAIVKDSITSDAAFIKYEPKSTDEYDLYDIKKLNAVVNISTTTKRGELLTANCKPFNGVGDTIIVHISTSTSGTYQLQTNDANQLIEDKTVLLHDKFTNKVIDLKTTGSYSFDIDVSNAPTFGSNRFELLIGTDYTPTYVAEKTPENYFVAYPAIVTNLFSLKSNNTISQNWQFTLYNSNGKVAFEENDLKFNSNIIQFNFSHLPTGVYYGKVTNTTHSISQIVRFIKQ